MKLKLSKKVRFEDKEFEIFAPIGVDISDVYQTVKKSYRGDIKLLTVSAIEYIYCSILLIMLKRLKGGEGFVQSRKNELDKRLSFVEPHWVKTPYDLIKDQSYAFDDNYYTFEEMTNAQRAAVYTYLEPLYKNELTFIYRNDVITGFDNIIKYVKGELYEPD